MKVENYAALEFPSRSANEGFARAAAACFACLLYTSFPPLFFCTRAPSMKTPLPVPLSPRTHGQVK